MNIRIDSKIIILFFSLLSINLLAQNNLKKILQSSNNYEQIVKEGEQYFQTKYPNTRLSELTQGEHRDGEFVKFMRWRSFWEHSLNTDGTLGDISAYWKTQQNRQNNNASPYQEVAWTNLSYENYITQQIGLGRTTSIAFHPTDPKIFYVGAAIGGIWRTTDGGQTYTPLGDDLPFLAVGSIVLDQNNPEIIYIGISDHVWYGIPGIGVYKSIDGGDSWQPTALSFDFTDNIRIFWMEADPNDQSKIFVATADGLYRTIDGFNTVEKINNTSTLHVKVNLENSNIVYQGSHDGTFYRSTDGGNSFSLIQSFGNSAAYIALTPLNTSKVYVRNGMTLYKSTNNGASFSTTTHPLPEDNSVLMVAPSNQNILITGNFETQRSDNDGTSFYPTSQWLGRDELPLIHVDQRNIFYNPLENDYVYYCNDGGVYRYIISTNQFENLSNGLMITQFYDIAVSQTNKNIIGGGSQDNGNVFRDANGVWDDYAPTGDGMNQEIDPTNENIRYWAYQNGAMRRWENGSNINISPPGKDGEGAWETPYRLDPNNSSRLIAGYDVVYESFNKGDTWTAISGAIFGGNLNEIAIAPSNSNRIYATKNNQLFVKHIANNTWENKLLPNSVSDIEVDPFNMDIIYISVPGFSNNSKVYKSTDAGTTWANISGTLPNVSADAIELYHNLPGGIFVGTDAGVYYRDDNLSDWQEYGALPHTRVEDIEIQYAEKLIRVGTYGRGVLEAPIAIINCQPSDPDADNDGVCDANDLCPNLDDNLLNTPCDDGNPQTSGEKYNSDCTCGGGASNITYCNAAGSAGTGADWIRQVKLNTLNYSSTQSPYSDFRSQSTTLTPGTSYTLTIALNHSFAPDEAYAWIDYNQNGVFESSESINMSSIDSGHKSQGTITVPANIEDLVTTMRVRVIYDTPNLADPCGNYFGEVEDYTISIQKNCVDTDNDGVCDANDLCPNLDDNLLNTPCDDGNPQTSGEKYNSDCTCGGGASNITYCNAAGSAGTGADWIRQVKLNTLNYSSTQSPYSDFRSQSTTLTPGTSYTLTIALNHSFAPDEAYAWIDYNQNGVFESSESINMSSIDSEHKSQGTVTVSANIEDLVTTMRVRVIYDTPNLADPCGNYFGEVEDYTISIQKNCVDTDKDGVCDEVDVCVGYSDTPLLLTSQPTEDKSYKAVSTIESTVEIVAPLDITYSAGQTITLQEGFEVKNGATFHAFIEDCTSNTSLTTKEPISDNKAINTEKAINRTITSPSTKPEVLEAPILTVFPNPFNGITNVLYTLPKDSPIKLAILDMTGKELEIILDTKHQKAGNYQFQWQSPIDFSGMLLLSLSTKDQVVIKKLVTTDK